MGRHLLRRETVAHLLLTPALAIWLAAALPAFGETGPAAGGPLPLHLDHAGRSPAPAFAGGRPDAAPLGIRHHRHDPPLLGLSVPEDPAVEQWRERVLERDFHGLQDALKRGHAFRRFITERLAERDLPQELFFLPVLESHYKVRAVSRSGATGMWQIMANTAAPLGLRSDRWVDQRRDFWKSTEGALRKLEENYRTFGDWDLALAAYNCGSGALSRTIQSSGIRDFWTLRDKGLLRPETAAYVPKFYALLAISNDRSAFGLETGWEPAPLWERLPLTRSVELALVAEAAGVPLALLEEAHAELQSPITPPPSAHPYALKIPSRHAERVRAVVEDPQRELLRFTCHRVRSGDSFYALARYYGLSVALLMEANPGVQPRAMRLGQQLRIPVFTGRPLKEEPIVTLSEEQRAEFSARYTVMAGDTLWEISRLHGTTAEMLAWVNGRSLDALLKPGETLKVPPREAAEGSGSEPMPEAQGENR